MKYERIDQHRGEYSVPLMCKALHVSPEGYYAWKRRPARIEDRALATEIRIIHAQSRKTYGSPRVTEELHAQGKCINHKRVERVMKAEGIRAKAARKYKATTNSEHTLPVAPNLLKRDFTATAPNQKWATDITYLWTEEGWMYLCVVLDLYSRAIVGWALKRRLTADLACQALTRAVTRRSPPRGLIVHSDRGIQYASCDFRNLLKKHGLIQSMSRLGDCWDNATMESFFHSFKIEAVYGNVFESRRRIEAEVFDYIENFYNNNRRHSSINYCSPLKFERLAA